MSSKTGPSLVHEVFIYGSDDEFVSGLSPFVREGMAAGEQVIVLAREDRNGLLRRALKKDAKKVSFIDAAEWMSVPSRTLEQLRALFVERLTAGTSRLWVVGEPPFGRSKGADAAWLRFEAGLNGAFARWPISFVCIHDARELSDRMITDARDVHPHIRSGERTTRNQAFVPPDTLFSPAMSLETGEALALATASHTDHIHGAIRTVSSAARAAGFTDETVEGLRLSASNFIQAMLETGKVTIQISRQRGCWICDVAGETPRDDTVQRLVAPKPGDGVGAWIARLVCDEVSLVASPDVIGARLVLTPPDADPRERILVAASELFYQRGTRATGIDAIIAHAGVAKASFYHHFASKDDLIAAWLSRPETRWFERVCAETDARAKSPARRLLVFFDVLGDWFEQDDFRGCPFINTVVEIPDRGHPAGDALREMLAHLRLYFRRAAKEADLADTEAISQHLVLLVKGAIVSSVGDGSAEAARTARAAARRLIGARKG